MSKQELIELRTILIRFCENEKQLISEYPIMFCDRDFDRIKSLLSFMKNL
jgi:hypothetical protein